MLSYNAPKCGTGPITLAGLDVTDNGFGVWNVTFPVVGGQPLDADGDCDATGAQSTVTTIVGEALAIALKESRRSVGDSPS